MINHEAIYALYPNVITIQHETAFDVDGNEVEYDKNLVEQKAIELEAQTAADVQKAIDTKQSALAKLSAIGLTEDEIKALIGI
jgi:hypothetical protein